MTKPDPYIQPPLSFSHPTLIRMPNIDAAYIIPYHLLSLYFLRVHGSYDAAAAALCITRPALISRVQTIFGKISISHTLHEGAYDDELRPLMYLPFALAHQIPVLSDGNVVWTPYNWIPGCPIPPHFYSLDPSYIFSDDDPRIQSIANFIAPEFAINAGAIPPHPDLRLRSEPHTPPNA
jgi:hypothetical protein